MDERGKAKATALLRSKGALALEGMYGGNLSWSKLWRSNVVVGHVHGQLQWYTYAVERPWEKERSYRSIMKRRNDSRQDLNMLYQSLPRFKYKVKDIDESIERIGAAYARAMRKRMKNDTKFSWVIESSNQYIEDS